MTAYDGPSVQRGRKMTMTVYNDFTHEVQDERLSLLCETPAPFPIHKYITVSGRLLIIITSIFMFTIKSSYVGQNKR
jgi:hypothetical protein